MKALWTPSPYQHKEKKKKRVKEKEKKNPPPKKKLFNFSVKEYTGPVIDLGVALRRFPFCRDWSVQLLCKLTWTTTVSAWPLDWNPHLHE